MITNTRLLCRDAIYDALADEMSRRDDDPGLGWIDRERTAVLNAAHDWASAHDMSCTVTAVDVERVATSASGHVDYASKLALYVADLVIEDAS